ncbi:MAG: BT4734/BF3469 family protein, partial [Bacteroidales bacterium]
MITLFKSVKDTQTPFVVTDEFVFDKIKSGSVKDLVQQIRTERDKDKRNLLKAKLPAICFSGEFSHRSKNGFKKHSGLICLDFDHFESDEALASVKDVLMQSEYTYALFVSPSGDGLKLVMRVPIDATVEDHTAYYVAACDFLSVEGLDAKTKDVARACYMSYDPNIYINKNATVWTTKEEWEQKQYHYEQPALILSDSTKIINQLRKWWDKKYSMQADGRNNCVYILASAFNEYGIPINESMNYIMQFEEKGFTRIEIETCVRSAYSKKSVHNTKFFNDIDTLKDIKDLSRKGHNKKDITKKLSYKIINKTELEAAIDTVTKELTTDVFWYVNDKGQVSIINNDFRIWCSEQGFYKYYHEGSSTFVFIRKENNLIDNTSEVKIKDYVMDFLVKGEHFKMYEYLAPKTTYFSDKYLNILPTLNVDFKNDTKDICYLYFKNKALEITKDNIKEIDYIDLDGFVWKQHLINSDYNKSDYT